MPVGDRIKLSGPEIQTFFGTPNIDMELIAETVPPITVREADFDIDTGIEAKFLDRLTFNATGLIWAGVVFTGQNGPNGWNSIDPDPKFPLVGSHPYCLIGRMDGRYFFVGDGQVFFYRGKGSRVALRTNDDSPGNGTGAFDCTIQQWRRV